MGIHHSRHRHRHHHHFGRVHAATGLFISGVAVLDSPY